MEFIKSDILKHSNLKHAFCLRSGGVSPNPYKSLNCSYYVGDQNINVKKNHELILKSLNFEKSFSVRQVHGNKVVCAEDHLNKNTEISEDNEHDYEFNQDIEFESEIKSPGWIRYQKRLK